jgi:hypothetical protein
MSIVPTDLLVFAQSLAASPTEVGLRAAASRAYYAAYSHALSYARQNSIEILKAPPEDRAGAHGDLIYTFRSHSSKNIKEAAYALQSAKDIRSKADYRLSENLVSNDVKLVIAYTKQVFSEL